MFSKVLSIGICSWWCTTCTAVIMRKSRQCSRRTQEFKFMIYQLVPSESRNYQPVTIINNKENKGKDYVIKFD